MSHWYFETLGPLGRWSPNAALTPPRVEKHAGVQRIGSGTGPRIRALSPIHPDHARLSLDELARIYGPQPAAQE